MKIDVLKKAYTTLEEVLKQPYNDFIRDATIQRFEYTFELTWKAFRRYFKENNKIDLDSVKDVLREAAKQGLIDQLELWFDFLDARNQASHLYNQDTANDVYALAKQFAPQAEKAIVRLEKLI